MYRRMFEQPGLHIYCIVLLCLLLFVPFLGARDFWGLENEFAEVIRVMLLDGNYALPTVNGALWTASPPFYFWLATFFSWLAGESTEWAIRLPSAISGTELILVFYYFVRKRFNARIAFVSTIVLATSVLTIHVERHVPVNTTFYLFVILAIFLVMEVLVFGSRRAIHIYGVWFFMGLACLTSGPMGILVPAMVVCPYLALSGRWRNVLALRPLSGGLLFAAVIAPWAALVAWQTSGAWAKIVYTQLGVLHYPRHRGADHQFFFSFPLAFAPWCFLLIPALFSLWRERSKIWQDEILFLSIWFATVVLFSNLLPGHHGHYLFLAYFPAALGLGIYLNRLTSSVPGDALRVWTHRFVVGFCLLLVSAAVAAPIIAVSLWPFVLAPAVVLSCAVASVAVWVFYSSKRSNDHALICGFAVFAIVINLLLQGHLFPVLNSINGRPFAAKIGALAHRQSDSRVAIYDTDTIHKFNYYSKIRRFESLKTGEDVRNFLDASGPKFILVRDKRVKHVKEAWPENLDIVLTGITAEEHWVLLYSCNAECEPFLSQADQ